MTDIDLSQESVSMTWKVEKCTLCLKELNTLVSGLGPRINERGAAYRCGLMAVVTRDTGLTIAPMGTVV